MKSIGDIIKSYKKDGVVISPEYKYYKIENARDKINYYFQAFLAQENKVFRDHKEYDEVAEWLEDTKGKGLFLYGSCGTGKSMLARRVLPSIIYMETKGKNRFQIFDAFQMGIKEEYDKMLYYHYIVLDDIGNEGVLNQYNPNKKYLLPILDAVEKKGKIIIMTSNLCCAEDIIEKYDEPTYDRIKGVTKPILFDFESMR